MRIVPARHCLISENPDAAQYVFKQDRGIAVQTNSHECFAQSESVFTEHRLQQQKQHCGSSSTSTATEAAVVPAVSTGFLQQHLVSVS